MHFAYGNFNILRYYRILLSLKTNENRNQIIPELESIKFFETQLSLLLLLLLKSNFEMKIGIHCNVPI